MMTKTDYRDATEVLDPAYLVLDTMAKTLAGEPAQLMRNAHAALASAIACLEAGEQSAPADEVEAIAIPALRPGETVDDYLVIAATAEAERRQRQGAEVETIG